MTIAAPPDNLLREYEGVYRYLIDRALFLQKLDNSLRFTSWYRDPNTNRSVGGHEESQHLFGFAFDAVSNRPDQLEQIAKQLGLIPVVEFDHVHFQLFQPGVLRSLGLFGIEV